jgi:hypothetical protein
MAEQLDPGNTISLENFLAQLPAASIKTFTEELSSYPEVEPLTSNGLADGIVKLDNESLEGLVETMSKLSHDADNGGSNSELAPAYSLLMAIGVEEQDRRTQQKID